MYVKPNEKKKMINSPENRNRNRSINKQTVKGKIFLFALCGFDLGGAERQAMYLARYLKELGGDVRVWGHHHLYHGPEKVIEQCEAMNIPWAEYKFRWPCGKAALLRDSFRLLKGLYKERPDIILSYTKWPNIGCGLVWPWSPAKVFIWGQRDISPLKNDWPSSIAYKGASAIICNASHEINYLTQALGKTSVPMHVVHNGVKLDPPQKTRSQWRKALCIPQNAIIVTMLANLRSDKDHSTLLHAWRKVVDSYPKIGKIKLFLAGSHQESFDDVERLISELLLSENVTLPGQISDVAGFLAACDIGVLITQSEGLPNAILEYMDCGLPIVATDIPGNREALGDNADDQLCRPNDPENLAEKLNELILSPSLRHRLGDLNYKRSVSKFSIDTMCDKMSSIIIETLENRT